MQKFNTASELKNYIRTLELRQKEEAQLLKEQFQLTTEAVRPINLLKSTFRHAIGTADAKEGVVNTSVGLTAGYLSKVLFERNSHNPIRRILGTALQFGVTNMIAKNPEAVKSVGNFIFNAFRGRRKARELAARNNENDQEN